MIYLMSWKREFIPPGSDALFSAQCHFPAVGWEFLCPLCCVYIMYSCQDTRVSVHAQHWDLGMDNFQQTACLRNCDSIYAPRALWI